MSKKTTEAIEAATATPEVEQIPQAEILTIEQVDSYVLPGEIPEGAPPHKEYRIADDDVADWAIQKVLDAKAEYQRIADLGEREIQRIKEKIEAAAKRCEADTSYLTGRLAEYFQTVPHKTTKTTEKYKLINGTLVMKRGAVKFQRDDAKLIPWLKANGHEGLVKTKEEVAWADLKKLIAPAGSMAIIGDTGEIIEGIEATVSPDEFKIE